VLRVDALPGDDGVTLCSLWADYKERFGRGGHEGNLLAAWGPRFEYSGGGGGRFAG